MESDFHPSIIQYLTTMVTSLIPLHFSLTRNNNLRANWTIYIARRWNGWLVFVPRIIFNQTPYWMDIMEQPIPFKYAQPFSYSLL
jgi:hypothetical protein